jgi:hypothetical protein
MVFMEITPVPRGTKTNQERRRREGVSVVLLHRRSPWGWSDMGSAGPRSPFAAMKADPAGAGAPSREEAKALARPAGAAEDTGA